MISVRVFAALFFSICAVCIAGSLPGNAAALVKHQPTPPDSFLRYKVYSVNQLIQQMRSDAIVRARFARHFHIPQSRVLSYMTENLVESYIPENGRYTVYCVRATGTIYPVVQQFRQGTKVFALRNGQPVMKWVCGNPLSRFLPVIKTKTVVKTVPVVKVSPSIEMITPTDAEDIFVPTEPAMVDVPLLDTPSANLAVPSMEAVSTPVFSSGGGLGGSSLLALLPIGFLAGHSPSNSGHDTHLIPPPPVPEPSQSTFVAVLLGFAATVALSARWRHAQRRPIKRGDQ